MDWVLGNSMVRVKNMSLRPDNNHQQLSASDITLVASHQKKPVEKPATAKSPAKVASAKPPPATPASGRTRPGG